MLRIIIVFFFIINSAFLCGQEISKELFLYFTPLYSDIDTDSTANNKSYMPVASFSFGVQKNKYLNKKFEVRYGYTYARNGSKEVRDFPLTKGGIQYSGFKEYKYDYFLEGTVKLNYYLTVRKTSFYVIGGLKALAYLFSKHKRIYYNGENTLKEITTGRGNYRIMNLRPFIGFGITRKVGKHRLLIEPFFEYSLQNQKPNINNYRMNYYSIGINLGFTFPLQYESEQ